MTASIRSAELTSRIIRAVGNKIASRGVGEGRLCIVNYHRVLEFFDPLLESEPDISTFRSQMKMLGACFNVMPLHDAIQALTEKRIPPRAVCISFDDGYRSIHDFALPILKEFNLPATVFVTAGYVGGNNMWNDRIIEAVRRMPEGQLDLREVGLDMYMIQTLHDRKCVVNKLTASSKYLPSQARLDLAAKLEELVGYFPAQSLMLTKEMIWNLVQQGIEIGGHTVTHPILTSLKDREAYYEIVQGKQELEAITGQPVRLFAYPNGKVGVDFDERHVAMVQEAGFTAAFTTAMGAATSQHDRYQLPRSCPWDSTSFLYAMRLLRWLADK